MKNVFVGNMNFQTTEAELHARSLNRSDKSLAFTSPWTEKQDEPGGLHSSKCPTTRKRQRPCQAWMARKSAEEL